MQLITVTVSGDEKAIARFEGMAIRMDNMAPVLEWAKKDLTKAWRTNFASNGLLVGGWAPLDPEYFSWKMVRFPGAPTLVRTGRLFRSLGESNVAMTIGKDEAVIGTNLRYAKFHQYGTDKMPKRPVVFEPKGFAAEFGRRALRWVSRGII